jgi:hypothetical protein
MTFDGPFIENTRINARLTATVAITRPSRLSHVPATDRLAGA